MDRQISTWIDGTWYGVLPTLPGSHWCQRYWDANIIGPDSKVCATNIAPILVIEAWYLCMER